MIKIKEVIVVEGRYDKDNLSNILDTIIIETRGFRIFKDIEKRNYIKKLALERGIIILTDSDSAGFLIRNHLKSFIDDKYIKNAFIPQLKGKEKRKTTVSADGFLGVEAMSEDVIMEALLKAGVGKSEEKNSTYSTKDLFNYGLTGTNDSKIRKQKLLKLLELPSYLSNKELIKYMNINTQKAKESLEKIWAFF